MSEPKRIEPVKGQMVNYTPRRRLTTERTGGHHLKREDAPFPAIVCHVRSEAEGYVVNLHVFSKHGEAVTVKSVPFVQPGEKPDANIDYCEQR